MLAALAVLALAPMLAFDALGALKPSQCFGATNGGRLEGAVRMPVAGDNFGSYCLPCILALRTYGHAPAIEATLEAYAALAVERPETRYLYGEIGLPWGGRFVPHRTHRNGQSFDFMVPLTEGVLPTGIGNRFGYDEAFDADGKGAAGRIDFEALAAHLRALDAATRREGGRIALVVLAPDLQDELFAADPGLAGSMRFNRRASWVRHDDHYHVDFDFGCRPNASR